VATPPPLENGWGSAPLELTRRSDSGGAAGWLAHEEDLQVAVEVGVGWDLLWARPWMTAANEAEAWGRVLVKVRCVGPMR
jgi:hypothetical protein